MATAVMSETRSCCCGCRQEAHWEDLGMHGVRRINRAHGTGAKSIVWVLLLLLALALLVYQALGGVFYFLTFPTTVNFQLLPISEVPSPAVTLCNLNKFRLSHLYSEGWLAAVDHLYKTDYSRTEGRDSGNISARQAYTVTGHSINNMLLRCSHGVDDCRELNFSMTLTEHGVCYTFHKIGFQRLELLLNVEEYEYFNPSTQHIGIQVLLHDMANHPIFVEPLITIQPGHHSHLDVTASSVTSLSPPWGECGDDVDYSQSSCQAACMAAMATTHCGCAPFWSATEHKNVPRCSIQAEIGCVGKYVHQVQIDQTLWGKNCDCPNDCASIKFSPTIYQSELSTRSLERFLTDKQRYDITSEKLSVENIRARVNNKDLMTNSQNIISFTRSLDELRYQTETLKRNIFQVRQNVLNMADQMKRRAWFHFYVGTNGVIRMLKNGFLPQWEIVQQQYLKPLVGDCQLLLFTYGNIVKKLDMTSPSETGMRRILYTTMEEMLSARLELAIQGLDNFTKVYYSFLELNPSTSYIATPERRYDATLLPTAIIGDMEDTIREEYNAIADHLTKYMEQLLSLRNLLKDAYLSTSGLNKTEYQTTNSEFTQHSKQLQIHLDMFNVKVIDKIQESLERQMEQFKKTNETFFSSSSKLSTALFGVSGRLDTASLHNFPHVVEFAQDAQVYLGNSAKLVSDLAESGLSTAVEDNIDEFLTHINQLQELGKPLEEYWRKFTHDYLQMWNSMLHNENLQAFYTKLHTDVKTMLENPTESNNLRQIFAHNKMLGKSSEEMSEISGEEFYTLLNADLVMTTSHSKEVELEEMVVQFKRLTDITVTLHGLDKSLDVSYSSLRNSLDIFQHRSSLTDDFIKTSLISVSIQMANHGHEQIEEIVAYPMVQLLKDIGLLFPLFLGASVLTFFEAIDILCTCICSRKRKHCETKSTEAIPESPRHVTFHFPTTENHVASPTKPALKKPRSDYSDYHPSDIRTVCMHDPGTEIL